MEQQGTSMIDIRYLSGHRGSKCSYCGDPSNSVSCGFSANQLSLRDCFDSMNYGWCRCGDYFYKMNLFRSCCQMYVFRVDTDGYHTRKSHQRVLNKWNRFMAGEDVGFNQQKTEVEVEEKKMETDMNIPVYKKEKEKLDENESIKEAEFLIRKFLEDLLVLLETKYQEVNFILSLKGSEGLVIGQRIKQDVKIIKRNSKKQGDFTSNLMLLIFIENKDKLRQNGIDDIISFVQRIKNFVITELSSLNQIRVQLYDNGYIGFFLMKVDKNQVESIREIDANYDIQAVKKGEEQSNAERKEATHKGGLNSKKTQDNEERQKLPNETKKLETKFVKAQFQQDSFEMYKRYSEVIHGKYDITEQRYEDFLCIQGVEFGVLHSNGRTLELGCYHMKYYLDGRLIAVGVLDIFTECMHSMYFFYEPEFRELSIAVVGAVTEINYMKEMRQFFPQFRYYYMGFYIQTSPKMVYKELYQPAELLCPVTNTWVSLNDEVKQKIERREVRISGPNVPIPKDIDFSETNLEYFIYDNLLIYIKEPMMISDLNEKSQTHLMKVFKDVVPELGKRMSSSFVFGIPDQQ